MLRHLAKALFLFALLLSPFLHASSTEQDFQEGEIAFYHENYIEAHKYLTKASSQGDSRSNYYLGVMNLHGKGTPVNYKEAVRFFTLGASKNHPQSQIALGVLMVEGIGLPKNYRKASILFTKAAQKGRPDAQLILGWIYKHGLGVKESNAVAYALWNYVAAQGDEWARINRDAIVLEMSESELYRAQELSSNLSRLWKLLAQNKNTRMRQV